MSFFTDVLTKHPLFHTTKAVNDLALLEPVTRAAVVAIIGEAKSMGKELRPVETYRSCERQALLFQRGATTLKAVTVHHFGLACDVALYIGGKYIADGEQYQFLVDLGKKHGLISGRDWGLPAIKHDFIDSDHLQRPTLADQNKLFACKWYPPPEYSPYATMVASAK